MDAIDRSSRHDMRETFSGTSGEIVTIAEVVIEEMMAGMLDSVD